MALKPSTIAIHNGLNEDSQFGCVVPPIYLSSTYNFTGFNEPRVHDYSRRGNPGAILCKGHLHNLKAAAVR